VVEEVVVQVLVALVVPVVAAVIHNLELNLVELELQVKEIMAVVQTLLIGMAAVAAVLVRLVVLVADMLQVMVALDCLHHIQEHQHFMLEEVAVQLHNQQELEELVEMVAVVMVQNQV
jgi:hypothetical protein